MWAIQIKSKFMIETCASSIPKFFKCFFKTKETRSLKLGLIFCICRGLLNSVTQDWVLFNLNPIGFIRFPINGPRIELGLPEPLFTLFISSYRFPYSYLVTTSPQSSTPLSDAAIYHVVYNYRISFKQSQLSGRDGRCVQNLVTYSPHHNDMRLLAITPSYSRVSENNPN